LLPAVEYRRGQPAEVTGAEVVGPAGLAARLRQRGPAAAPAPTDAAVREQAHADDDDQQRGDSRRRDRGYLPDPLQQPRDRVPQAIGRRARRLHAQPQVVLETATRSRGLEGVVELALQRLELEVLVVFAHRRP